MIVSHWQESLRPNGRLEPCQVGVIGDGGGSIALTPARHAARSQNRHDHVLANTQLHGQQAVVFMHTCRMLSCELINKV